jgi:glutaconyl-CoA/methylmalonyl-CoA decarboxylase subunit delta
MTRKFLIPVLILLIQAGASAQQTAPSDLRILSGRVVELAYEGEDTVGLQGVRVYQLGSNRYTQTDVDGYFSLELPDSTIVVKIELFGYRNKEAQVHKGETSAMVVIERNLSFMEDEGLLITVVGMGVVFSALILLFLLFKFLLPVVNRSQRKKKAAADAHPGKFTVLSQDFSGEVASAISTALHLYFEEMHDEESGVLTIEKTVKSYSPWSSKIYQSHKALRGPHSSRW